MNIISVDKDDPRISLIEQGLNDYNKVSGVDIPQIVPFAFIAVAADGNFLGGAKGRIFAGWLELSWLYSAERSKGVGSALMKTVEEYACKQNCKGIFLTTFSFQAPEFYKKHGFEVFGEIPDFINGHTRWYMCKRT
jgi:GNAT superfamily N-acetyltransferase